MKTSLLAVAMTLALAVPGTVTASIVSSDTTKPKAMHVVKPAYPEAARLAGAKGAVVVECLVDNNGNVVDTGSVDRSVDPRLKEAALAAVSQWKFEPLHADSGIALVRVPILFELTANPVAIDAPRIAAR